MANSGGVPFIMPQVEQSWLELRAAQKDRLASGGHGAYTKPTVLRCKGCMGHIISRILCLVLQPPPPQAAKKNPQFLMPS